MRILRFLGMLIATVLLSVFISSCDSDDDETFSIVGSWKCVFEGNAYQVDYWHFFENGRYQCESVGDAKGDTSSRYYYSGNYQYNPKSGILTYTEEGSSEGDLTFDFKVQVINSDKMIWTDFSDEPGLEAIVTRE